VQQVSAAVVFVSELPSGDVVHCPNHSEAIRPLGQAREVFGESDAGEPGLDGAVRAPDTFRGFGLGVESFVLRGTSRLEDEYDRFRAACPTGRRTRLAFQPQQVRQAGAKQTEAADPQQLTAIDPVMVFVTAAYAVHDRSLQFSLRQAIVPL
jgi:hypothetical protein